MEINSSYLFKTYMSLAYRSRNPVETLFNHRVQGISRDFVRSYLQNQVLFDEIPENHPQYDIVSKIRQFLDEEDDDEDPVYYQTCFFRFATSVITLCSDTVFCFVKSNAPLEYAWFDISPDGKDVKMKQNTFSKEDVPLRVKFNRTTTYSFDLSNGMRLKTPRGDFLCIDGKRGIVTAPTSLFECVVVLAKGKEKPKIFYNDGPRLKVYQCGYLYYDDRHH
jgi:hypothetical protein